MLKIARNYYWFSCKSWFNLQTCDCWRSKPCYLTRRIPGKTNKKNSKKILRKFLRELACINSCGIFHNFVERKRIIVELDKKIQCGGYYTKIWRWNQKWVTCTENKMGKLYIFNCCLTTVWIAKITSYLWYKNQWLSNAGEIMTRKTQYLKSRLSQCQLIHLHISRRLMWDCRRPQPRLAGKWRPERKHGEMININVRNLCCDVSRSVPWPVTWLQVQRRPSSD